jgi:hypothetical protein
METVLSICLGLGLSAACGFRVFVPLLVMGAAARTGHLTLSDGFVWVASTPALVMLAAATAAEIAAYHVPWLDNLLDLAAAPAAVVAGVVSTASVVTGMDPYLKWTLAVIAGGGVAGVVQAATTLARQVSSLTTGGLGNPLLASAEAGGSVLASLVAVVAPLLAAAAVLIGIALVARRLLGRRPAPAGG